MSKPKPISVTIDEAVALMVNMDYIPTGFSLLDMTAAFMDEAEIEYDNALIDRLPVEQITSLEIRMESCRARHSLAELLLKSLQNEVKSPEESMIVLAKDSPNQPRLMLDSVLEWASDRFGIGIPKWLSVPPVNKKEVKRACWEDVTIKIYADDIIGFKLGNANYKRSSFNKIGLMGVRKKGPNKQGDILIALSERKKFLPEGQRVENKNAAAISKLRSALKKLTDLSEDPFVPFNEHDGWKPRFMLIDDRKNADNRAKDRALHVSRDDPERKTIRRRRITNDKKDQAQKWLDKNDPDYQ